MGPQEGFFFLLCHVVNKISGGLYNLMSVIQSLGSVTICLPYTEEGLSLGIPLYICASLYSYLLFCFHLDSVIHLSLIL